MSKYVQGEEFFGSDQKAVAIYRAVAAPIVGRGDVDVRVTKSQVAFRARRGFAYMWAPGRYVASDVPVVLSIALSERLPAARFKAIAHPSPGVWMHHLELRLVKDVDREVREWIRRAYGEARRRR